MKITGIILAGGKSSRMGSDKGFVELRGKTLVRHMIDIVKTVTDEIVIVTNKSEYECFGYHVVRDVFRNSGPMGGIHSGLKHSKTKKNLVLSCDIPFVTSEFLKFICRNSNGFEITVPVHQGESEPLCAVYNKNCSGKFEQLLLKGELKMKDSLKYFRMNLIDVSGKEFSPNDLFKNINSKTDLLKAEEFYNEN